MTNQKADKWRQAVLRRDHYFCRICHATQRLRVHRILPVRTHPKARWAMSNSITLCPACVRDTSDDPDILKFVVSIDDLFIP